jgi:hypothetical protein
MKKYAPFLLAFTISCGEPTMHRAQKISTLQTATFALG